MTLAIAAAWVWVLSPLGEGRPRAPDPVPAYEAPRCVLDEVIGARMVAISSCERTERCLLGACSTPDDRGSWPSVCADEPVLLILHERVDGRRQWAWYAFTDGGEIAAGVGEDEIVAASSWGQAFEADVRAAEVGELLVLLDVPPSAPIFSDCLDERAREHIMNRVVWLLFEAPAADVDAAWLALRQWFAAAQGSVWREPMYDRLSTRWRRTPDLRRAEFAVLNQRVLEQRTAAWADQRARGYDEGSDRLERRLARDRWLLGVAHEVQADRPLRERRDLDVLELEICKEWAAAREFRAVYVNVACDPAPRPSASSCNVVGDAPHGSRGAASSLIVLLLSLLGWGHSSRRRFRYYRSASVGALM